MQQAKIHNLITEEYPYTISKNETRGLYYTRLKDDSKKKITARTREELERKLYELYYSEDVNPTVDQVFGDYIEEKERLELTTDETIRRERDFYKKRVSNTALARKKIKEVKVLDIKAFFKSYDGQMKQKEITGVKSVLNGIWDYAADKDIVSVNVARNTRIKDVKRVVTDRFNNVYTEADRTKILDVLSKSTNIYDLAIELLFYTGLRSGEVRALKWSDIIQDENGGYFLVVRREVVTRNNKDVVEEHTKTGDDSGARMIPLVPLAYEILEKVPRKDSIEFIFTGRNDNPIYQQPLRERMRKVCDTANVKYRAVHKARATVTTMLVNNNVEMTTIMNIGGWKNTQTVQTYIRNVTGKEATKAAMMGTFG